MNPLAPHHRSPEPGRRSSKATILVAAATAVLLTTGLGAVLYVQRAGQDDAVGVAAEDSAATQAAGATYHAWETGPGRTSDSRSHKRLTIVPGQTIQRRPQEAMAAQHVADALHAKPSSSPSAETQTTQAARTQTDSAQTDSTQGFDFTMATLNLLGSIHTVKGGDKPGWPSASWRTPQAANYLRATGAQVIGTQEDKPDQLSVLTRDLGYDAYPGSSLGGDFSGNNSVLWDPDRFELVSGETFIITFMTGRHEQAVVRLRDKQTGREFYVVNMHVSAGHDAHDTATRYAGWRTGVDYINDKLKPTGLPIFITGDMNDRQPFIPHVLDPTGFHAAVYGTDCITCMSGGRLQVDWIAASPEVTWTRYDANGAMQAHKISDHFLVSAHANVPATQ